MENKKLEGATVLQKTLKQPSCDKGQQLLVHYLKLTNLSIRGQYLTLKPFATSNERFSYPTVQCPKFWVVQAGHE